MGNEGKDISHEDELRFRRIKLTKKILRHMPRRASVHRYPILNKFAESARRRPYLWSFRVPEVVPAFYIGWIITLMPIPSALQIVVAFFAAMVCRANVMILVFLQLLSNPLTFIPLWVVTQKVGTFVLWIFGVDHPKIPAADGHQFAAYSEYAAHGIATIVLGAIVLGSIIGAICSYVYAYLARKYSKSTPRQRK
jgi:uncharacterized protein (DUF2062 family)